ncbi:hypothetical protein QAD02_009574, partial [Eretmocerus hayati]
MQKKKHRIFVRGPRRRKKIAHKHQYRHHQQIQILESECYVLHQQEVHWHCWPVHLVQAVHQHRKARRKEKDAGTTEDPKLYLEEAALERQLPDVDMRVLVDLPAGLDYNEWLASHTLALFDHINLVYGTISEFCTPTGCPDMTGPGLRTYLWFDEKGKKTRVAAPQYIDYVMTFTQRTINDETIFPTKY